MKNKIFIKAQPLTFLFAFTISTVFLKKLKQYKEIIAFSRFTRFLDKARSHSGFLKEILAERYDGIVSLSLIKIEIYESIPLKKKNNFFFSRIENRVKILSVDKE